MTKEEKIVNCLSLIQIVPTSEQTNKLLQYYEMVIEKNKVMNLTTIVEFNDFLFKHFLDSLMISVYEKMNNQAIIDIGTGAGFPGIPLKILFENTRITLIDSLQKRIGFLKEVITELKLKDIKAIHGRAEELARKEEYRENFDVAVSRAVSSLNSLSEYCLPFIKRNGVFIAYKSGKAMEEVDSSRNAIRILSEGKIEVNEYKLPGTEYERTLIKVVKVKNTDCKYPRLGGKPTKQPL